MPIIVLFSSSPVGVRVSGNVSVSGTGGQEAMAMEAMEAMPGGQEAMARG